MLELLVHVLPVLVGVVASFLRLTPEHLRNWTSAPFAGTGNYRQALGGGAVSSSELLHSAGRTALYAVFVVALSWAIGMLAAVALARPFRGRAFFQLFFLLPFALPAYATVLAWRFAFARDTGLLNRLLVDDLHLAGQRPFWLIGDNAFWSVVIVSVWRTWPFAYLVLAAALRGVPRERFEAAGVDGASAGQMFRYVTLPGTSRASRLVIVLVALWSITDFSTPFLLFDQQPPPQATLLGNLVYRTAFVGFDFGVASAMNVLIVATLLVLGGAYAWRLRPRAAADA